MNEPTHGVSPLGLFSWFGYRLPLEQRLALAAGAGFDTVSLWLGKEEELVASRKWKRTVTASPDWRARGG
jgi:formylglycine-generating enzyme required for sulfatase activity